MNRTIEDNNTSLFPSSNNDDDDTATIMNDDSFDSSGPSRRGVARNSSNSSKYCSHPSKKNSRGDAKKKNKSKQDDMSCNILLSPVARRNTTANNTTSYFPPRSPFRSPRYNSSNSPSRALRSSPTSRLNFSPRKSAIPLDDNEDHTDDILNGLFQERCSVRAYSAKKELQTDNMDSLSSMLEDSRNGFFLDYDSESDEESSLGDDDITTDHLLLG